MPPVNWVVNFIKDGFARRYDTSNLRDRRSRSSSFDLNIDSPRVGVAPPTAPPITPASRVMFSRLPLAAFVSALILCLLTLYSSFSIAMVKLPTLAGVTRRSSLISGFNPKSRLHAVPNYKVSPVKELSDSDRKILLDAVDSISLTAPLAGFVTGLFRTNIDWWAAVADNTPIRQAETRMSFAPCARRLEINQYSTKPTSVLPFLGLDSEMREPRVAGTLLYYANLTIEEATETVGFVQTLAASFVEPPKEPGENESSWLSEIAVISMSDVSPALAAFWDGDFDEYIRLLDEYHEQDNEGLNGTRNWDVMTLSYWYPRQLMRTRYEEWRNKLPYSRFRLMVPRDARDLSRCTVWTKKGMWKYLQKMLEIVPIDKKDPITAEDMPPERFRDVLREAIGGKGKYRVELKCLSTSSNRRGWMQSCHPDYSIPETFRKTGYLIQPPLFTRRFIPEDLVTQGWPDFSSDKMASLLQSSAHSFKWAAENSEIMESLRSYGRLTLKQQSDVLIDALRRMQAKRGTPNSKELSPDELEKLLSEEDPVYLLAQRYCDSLPWTDWKVAEFRV